VHGTTHFFGYRRCTVCSYYLLTVHLCPLRHFGRPMPYTTRTNPYRLPRPSKRLDMTATSEVQLCSSQRLTHDDTNPPACDDTRLLVPRPYYITTVPRCYNFTSDDKDRLCWYNHERIRCDFESTPVLAVGDGMWNNVPSGKKSTTLRCDPV
jgi:hypothetical protein